MTPCVGMPSLAIPTLSDAKVLPVDFRKLVIDRIVELSRAMGHPGFNDDPDVIQQKFLQMSPKELITVFELTIVNSHRDGVQ